MSNLSALQSLLKGLSCMAKHPPRQVLYAEHVLAILAARKLWLLLRRRGLRGALKSAAGSLLSAAKVLPGASGVVEKEKQETLDKIEEFVLGKDDEEASHILTALPSKGLTSVAGATQPAGPRQGRLNRRATPTRPPPASAQQGGGPGAVRLSQEEGGRVPVGEGVRGRVPQAGCGCASLAPPLAVAGPPCPSLSQATTSTTCSARPTSNSATPTRSTRAFSPACASSRPRS